MVSHTAIADESLLTLVAYTRLFPKDHVCDFWDWFPRVAQEYFKESDDGRKMYGAAKKVAGKDRKYLFDEFEGEDLSFEERQIRQRALEIAMDLYPDYPDGADSQLENVGVYLLSEYGGDLSLLRTFLGKSFYEECARNDKLRKERDVNGFYDFPKEISLDDPREDLKGKNNYGAPEEVRENKEPVDSRDTSGNLGEEVSSPNKPLEELVGKEQGSEKKNDSSKSPPRDLTSERIYDMLLNTQVGDKATIHFNDGRIVRGALTFNPFKGTGCVINIDRETSTKYSIEEIKSLKLHKPSKPARKEQKPEDDETLESETLVDPAQSLQRLDNVEGPSDEELEKQTPDLEKLARDD